jgi:sugar phosphate isomerase/epimerase
MDTTMSVALALIGAGAAAAGVIGLVLPTRERLAGAVLALMAGAGVGVIALAVGWNGLGDEDGTAWERAFLFASALGFVAVAGCLTVAWRRRDRADDRG